MAKVKEDHQRCEFILPNKTVEMLECSARALCKSKADVIKNLIHEQETIKNYFTNLKFIEEKQKEMSDIVNAVNRIEECVIILAKSQNEITNSLKEYKK